MIEAFNPCLENMLKSEPWRNETDAGAQHLCNAQLIDTYFDGTEYWHCNKCGRIGKAPNLKHLPAVNPVSALLKRLLSSI